MKTSGIGGQAVIEGIMMRNKDKYAIAVRKPDDDIELLVKEGRQLTDRYKWLNVPVVRGVVNFIDSLVTGISTISYSASFYDDPDESSDTKIDRIGKAVFKEKLEAVLMALTVLFSVAVAIGLFMMLPYFVSRLLKEQISSNFLLNFIEGIVRMLVFFLYILLVSQMKDIKRTFMYHGAEHKCINCIEHGRELTPDNVKDSSRYHKRCGTSFLFLVMIISVIFFIFVRVDNTILQLVLRILLVPVIAGVSYEIIRYAGKNENTFTNIISKPGILLQKLTTKEPDMDMIEVAIKAVEAVFDVDAFLETFDEDDYDEASAMESGVDGKDDSAGDCEEYDEDEEEYFVRLAKALDEDDASPDDTGEEDSTVNGADDDSKDCTDTDIEESADDEGFEFEVDDGLKDDLEVYAEELPVFKQRRTE